jgi:hypothetical protein
MPIALRVDLDRADGRISGKLARHTGLMVDVRAILRKPACYLYHLRSSAGLVPWDVNAWSMGAAPPLQMTTQVHGCSKIRAVWSP